jgi:actin-related protein 5
MLREFCEFSTDYPALLRTLKDPLKLRSPEVERVIQFPFTVAIAEEKSEEELARIAERRREQGKKLQELAAKTRLDKARSYLLASDLCVCAETGCIARAEGS